MKVTLRQQLYSTSANVADPSYGVFLNIDLVAFQRENEDWEPGANGRVLLLAKDHYSAILIEEDTAAPVGQD